MTDQELRALVRDAVERHLGRRLAAAPASVSRPASVVSHAASPLAVHPSHAIYLSVVNSDDACVIQPSVQCDHCGYCKSHGH